MRPFGFRSLAHSVNWHRVAVRKLDEQIASLVVRREKLRAELVRLERLKAGGAE